MTTKKEKNEDSIYSQQDDSYIDEYGEEEESQEEEDKRERIHKQKTYIVEAQLTVQEAQEIKKLSDENIFVYILRDTKHHYKFMYITTKVLFINTVINGLSLQFRKAKHNNLQGLSTAYTDMEERYVYLFSDKKIKKKKTKRADDDRLENAEISVIPRDLTRPRPYKQLSDEEKKKAPSNKYKIHQSRIAFDEPYWFFKELPQFTKGYHRNKVMKEILKDAHIQSEIRKVLISEFFRRKNHEFMQNETHSVVLTQGGTGKSSILGVLGTALDNSSTAGIFGFYDIKSAQWVAGRVSQTKKTIIIDETNELINKGETLMDTLNTPLEKGIYSSGKASGKSVYFANQFMFLGNIRDTFHFGNFIQGLSNNPLTVGRRIAYIVYNNNSEFINSTKSRIKEETNYIEIFSEAVTYVFDYMIKKKKVLNNNSKIEEIVKPYKNKVYDRCKKVENEDVVNFFKEQIKSYDTKLPFFALKLAIFDLFDDIIQYENLFRYPKNRVVDRCYQRLHELCEDSLRNFENIKKHINDSEIPSDKFAHIKKDIEKMTKREYALVRAFCLNTPKGKKKYFKGDFDVPGDTARLLSKFFSRMKEFNCSHKTRLQNYGLTVGIDNDIKKVYVAVNNKKIIDKYQEYFEETEKEEISEAPTKKRSGNEDKNVTGKGEEKKDNDDTLCQQSPERSEDIGELDEINMEDMS